MIDMTPADYVKRQNRQLQDIFEAWDNILRFDLDEDIEESDEALDVFIDLVNKQGDQFHADLRNMKGNLPIGDWDPEQLSLADFHDDLYSFNDKSWWNIYNGLDIWYRQTFLEDTMRTAQFVNKVADTLSIIEDKWDKLYDKFVDVRQLDLPFEYEEN